jgi:DNA-binding transcriptional LysR family regulator
MDMRQLQRFVAVVDSGSFNRAAETLAVSQPSLTRSIQLLEEALQGSLFDRGPRGVVLTTAGQELLPRARLILSERDRALVALRSLTGKQAQTISIGTDASFSMQRIPVALSKLAVSHPTVHVTVREGPVGELLDLLKEGSLNLVFGARSPALDLGELEFRPLATESAGVILRADHPQAKSRRLRLHDISARWIVPSHPALEQGWRAMFAEAGVPVPSIAVRTSSLHVIKGCLLSGPFVSLGDRSSFAEEIAAGRLVCMDAGGLPYERPIGVFRRSGLKPSELERALTRLLKGG